MQGYELNDAIERMKWVRAGEAPAILYPSDYDYAIEAMERVAAESEEITLESIGEAFGDVMGKLMKGFEGGLGR